MYNNTNDPIKTMSKVTAVMRCYTKTERTVKYKSKDETGCLVWFAAQYTDDESMREYCEATPNGNMMLAIDNPDAAKFFAEQKNYKITIEEYTDPNE